MKQVISEGSRRFQGEGVNRSSKQHRDKVKEVVAEHRQKLSVAREELEQALGKSFSQDTLKRFVKKTLAVIDESENVRSKSRVRISTPSRSTS